MSRSQYPVRRPPRPTAARGGAYGPRRAPSAKSAKGLWSAPQLPPTRGGTGKGKKTGKADRPRLSRLEAVALQAELLAEQEREKEARRRAADPAPAAGAPAPRRHEARGLRFEASRAVWTLVPIATFGLATPLPFLRRAHLLGNRHGRAAFTAYLATTVGAWSTVTLAPGDSSGEALGVLLLLAATLTASVHTFLTFRETAEAAGSGPAASVEEKNRWVVREALARRRLREAARRLAQRDPALARELRIGRGGALGYDDGGLVDVNTASAADLVDDLGLTAAEAAAVLRERDALGGRFSSLSELAVYANLPQARVDALAERIVLITP